MRKILIVCAALLCCCAIVTSGCIHANQTAAPSIIGTWNSNDISITFGDDGNVFGHAPVNTFTGSYKVSGYTISFGALGSTKMAGPENLMNAETAFFEALNSAAQYEVKDDALTIFDKTGKKLMSLSASQKDLTDTWHLSTDKTVTLILHETGNAGGNAPLNSYSGTYTVAGDKLSFSDMIHTLLAGDPERMKTEDAFFSALQKTASYKITDGKLELIDAEGNILLTFI